MASTIEKQAWLIDTIRRYGRISLRRLNEIWLSDRSLNPDGAALSVRTFHRHREEIANLFGLEIKCDRRDMNRYYIDDDVEGREVRDWLMHTVSVENMLSQCKELRHRIQYENIPSGNAFLADIIAAMHDGVRLQMCYHSFWSDRREDICLEPYFLKVDKKRWYLIGPSDVHPEDPHVYALDRIMSMALTDKTFIYPEDFSPEAFFRNDYGVFHSHEHPVRIVLKVAKSQCRYIESLPVHHTQERVEEGPEWNVYRMYLCPNDDFIRHILSNGADYEVLEPASLREEVIRRLASAMETYGRCDGSGSGYVHLLMEKGIASMQYAGRAE